MLVMACYINNINNPNDPYIVKKFSKIHNEYINLRYVKPHGKGILIPFIVEGMRFLTKKRIPLIIHYRRLDLLFVFVSFLIFYLLVKKMNFDLRSCLILILAFAFYLFYGFIRVHPVWRCFDIPNLMFCVLGLYFIFTNFRIAFLVNLISMTFNKESSLLLIIILFTYLLLNHEENIKNKKFAILKNDIGYCLSAIILYISIEIFLEKIVVFNIPFYNLPWPWSFSGISTMLYYAPKNFSLTGLKFLFTWFNLLLILSFINYYKKSNFSKAVIYGAFFYVLSAYLVGGIFGEGEGILLPVVPMLLLASSEELRRLGILNYEQKDTN
jgi:hypothetical protein